MESRKVCGKRCIGVNSYPNKALCRCKEETYP